MSTMRLNWLQARHKVVSRSKSIIFRGSGLGALHKNRLVRHQRLLHAPSRATASSDSDEELTKDDVPMRQLVDPAAKSDSTPLSRPDSSAPGNNQEPRGLLQRIAHTFMSLMTVLIPAKLRTAWTNAFKPRNLRLAIFFFIGAGMAIASSAGRRGVVTPPPQEVMYSDFLNMVNSGNVRAARFEEGTGRILFDMKPHSSQVAAQAAAEAKLAADQASTPTASFVRTNRRSRYYVPRQFYTRHIADPQLISTLNTAGVEFGAVRASVAAGFARVIATALALWLPLIPLFIIMRRFIEGRNGGGSKKKKSRTDELQRITFADVAGVGQAKAELEEVVACLKDAGRFARVGAKLPSGVLLCGPPGTGKTLLAKAVAGEAGVPFIAASASEFVELFVGRGAARVRELFAEARKVAPCVVFIDELDAVGGRRGAGLNEERDQTLNQLLTELDGFEGRPGVMLLAATNRPEVLDSALMRPGRLSRKVNVPLPDELGRSQILKVHMRKVPLAGGSEARDVAAATVARLTSGCNGAELANVVNEAAFMAARREGDAIDLNDLLEAVNRTRFGVNGGSVGGGGSIGKWLQGMVVDLASSKNGVRTQPLGS